MQVLITGASGFVGKTLVPVIQSQGHDIVAISSKNCDLRDSASLAPFNDRSFDLIYHLAVWTQAGDFCLYHPGEQWLMNQKINTNVLDWWSKKQPQAKLIAIGTSCAYDPDYPLEEAYYLKGSPIESLMAYGMTKRMLLCGLSSLHQQFGLNYLFLIPSTLYGIAGYHTDGKQLHFIFDIIRKIMRGALFGDPVVLWGDGEQKRELVHVDDFIAAMLQLAGSVNHEAVNIGEGHEHSIKEFARMVCDQTGYPFSKIGFDTGRYVGARSKVLSISKLKSLLPDYQVRLPESGIREMVEWLLQNRHLL